MVTRESIGEFHGLVVKRYRLFKHNSIFEHDFILYTNVTQLYFILLIYMCMYDFKNRRRQTDFRRPL